MPLSNKTYQPLHPVTLKVTEDIPAFRFVSHLGSLCIDGGRAVGVTEVNWTKDEFAAVNTLGTILIETTTTINAGCDITAAGSGKARTAGSGDAVNGRALDGCEGNSFVKIKLVP